MKPFFLKRALVVILSVCMFCTAFGTLASTGVAHAAARPTTSVSATSMGHLAARNAYRAHIIPNSEPGGSNQVTPNWYEDGGCNVADFSFQTHNGAGHNFCIYFLQTNTWGVLNFSSTPGLGDQPNTFSILTGSYGGGWFEYNNGTYQSFGDNQSYSFTNPMVTLDAVFLNGCQGGPPC